MGGFILCMYAWARVRIQQLHWGIPFIFHHLYRLQHQNLALQRQT